MTDPAQVKLILMVCVMAGFNIIINMTCCTIEPECVLKLGMQTGRPANIFYFHQQTVRCGLL